MIISKPTILLRYSGESCLIFLLFSLVSKLQTIFLRETREWVKSYLYRGRHTFCIRRCDNFLNLTCMLLCPDFIKESEIKSLNQTFLKCSFSQNLNGIYGIYLLRNLDINKFWKSNIFFYFGNSKFL